MLFNHLIFCHPFSFCRQSFPASGSFPMSWLFASGGQSIGAAASASVLPNRWENNGNSERLFSWAQKSQNLGLQICDSIITDHDCSNDIKGHLLLGREAITNLDSILKNRETFANKGLSSQKHGFSSSHVWMWELDHKECWGLKNRCFWTVVLKTLESPSDCKEIKPVNPKGNKSWIFIGRTDYEAEVPILWLPDVKNWLIGKDPAAGEGWKQEEKGTTEDGMVGWHHWLNGHEFEQTLGIDDGQGSLACCSPWGHKESDMTKWLNWTEKLNKIWAK